MPPCCFEYLSMDSDSKGTDSPDYIQQWEWQFPPKNYCPLISPTQRVAKFHCPIFFWGVGEEGGGRSGSNSKPSIPMVTLPVCFMIIYKLYFVTNILVRDVEMDYE